MNTIKELKQKGKELHCRIAKLADDSSDGVWRTVRGRRIFIGKGESFDDALKKSLGGKSDSGANQDKLPGGMRRLNSQERHIVNSRHNPDKSIDTGLDANKHAESLDIYYADKGDQTFVVPSNAGAGGHAFALSGKVTPSTALAHYKRTLDWNRLSGAKATKGK